MQKKKIRTLYYIITGIILLCCAGYYVSNYISLSLSFFIFMNYKSDDLEFIDNISIYGKKINLINGLEKCENLRILKIEICKLNKIVNLRSLNKLIELSLSGNNIEKIENLDSLVNLETLDLSFNKINKIENVDSLISLTKLNLNANTIKKIENIENNKRLKWLYINDNPISEISDKSYYFLKKNNVRIYYNTFYTIEEFVNEYSIKISQAHTRS